MEGNKSRCVTRLQQHLCVQCAAALIRINPETEEQNSTVDGLLNVHCCVYEWIILGVSAAFTCRDQHCILLIVHVFVVPVCIYLVWFLLRACVCVCVYLICTRQAVFVCSLLYCEHILTSASQQCIPVVIVSVKRKQSFKNPVLPVFAGAETLTFQLKFRLCVGVFSLLNYFKKINSWADILVL